MNLTYESVYFPMYSLPFSFRAGNVWIGFRTARANASAPSWMLKFESGPIL